MQYTAPIIVESELIVDAINDNSNFDYLSTCTSKNT